MGRSLVAKRAGVGTLSISPELTERQWASHAGDAENDRKKVILFWKHLDIHSKHVYMANGYTRLSYLDSLKIPRNRDIVSEKIYTFMFY